MARRRALSTIVGALIFVALLVASFSSLLTAMNFMTSFQQESIAISSKNQDLLNEDFGMRAIVATNCELDVEVVNEGSVPVKIEDLFLVVDPTLTTSTTTRYDVNNMVVPPETRKTVTDGVTSTITLTTSKEYLVKVVTELGTVKEKFFATGSSCGSKSLVGKLVAIPPEIATSDNVTMAFIVMNMEEFDLRQVELSSSTLTASPSSAIDDQTLITDDEEPNLVAGGSTIFMWTVEITGAIGQVITFSTSATDSFGDTTGTVSTEIKITKEFTASIVSQRLVAKPEVFIITPGPFGESAQKALWGAIIVNPTETTFNVNRVTFILNTVGSESSQNLVETSCSDDGITPDVDTEWSCPNENLIDWKGSSVSVAGGGAAAFMVLAKPGSTGTGGNDIAAFTTSVSVLTSAGQFSKGNYASGMEGSSSGGPIANVYLARKSVSDAGALTMNSTNPLGYTSMSTSGGTQTLAVALADFDSGAEDIPNGSRLIVNVPAGFDLVTNTAASIAAISSTKFPSTGITITEYTDGSNQIVATVNQDIGDGAAEAAVLKFQINPPTVDETRAYIMYCLLDGNSSTGIGLSANAEVPLRVTFP